MSRLASLFQQTEWALKNLQDIGVDSALLIHGIIDGISMNFYVIVVISSLAHSCQEIHTVIKPWWFNDFEDNLGRVTLEIVVSILDTFDNIFEINYDVLKYWKESILLIAVYCWTFVLQFFPKYAFG